MNKTEENLRRIRAYDAEQWRTIKGRMFLLAKTEQSKPAQVESLMGKSSEQKGREQAKLRQ